MEHQFRRGIYRPNAQRLSISLAPLVAQRSLLFRVKADLATKTSYGQLSPTTDESESDSESESPALFLLTPAGIRVASAVPSAMSTASVYSQDSWKGNSPFVPVLTVDTRRHAIAFSPSLQWSDLSEEDEYNEHLAEQPRYTAPVSAPSTVAFQEDSSAELNCVGPVTTMTLSVEVATKSPIPQIKVILESQETGTPPQIAKLKKKKPEDSTTKRASKHSKAFGKVISRLSLQPSKKELGDRRRTELATSHPMPELKLPRLPELQLADPIRMSFIAKSSGCLLGPPATTEVQMTIEEEDDTSEKDYKAAEKNRLVRSTMPPTIPSEKRSLAPPPIALPSTIPPTRATKGHRRYRSSPAVMNFDFRQWDAEKMPPLPVIPLSLKVSIPTTISTTPVAPVRTRSRSITNHGVQGI